MGLLFGKERSGSRKQPDDGSGFRFTGFGAGDREIGEAIGRKAHLNEVNEALLRRSKGRIAKRAQRATLL